MLIKCHLFHEAFLDISLPYMLRDRIDPVLLCAPSAISTHFSQGTCTLNSSTILWAPWGGNHAWCRTSNVLEINDDKQVCIMLNLKGLWGHPQEAVELMGYEEVHLDRHLKSHDLTRTREEAWRGHPPQDGGSPWRRVPWISRPWASTHQHGPSLWHCTAWYSPSGRQLGAQGWPKLVAVNRSTSHFVGPTRDPRGKGKDSWCVYSMRSGHW